MVGWESFGAAKAAKDRHPQWKAEIRVVTDVHSLAILLSEVD
jgi:hypothetical protein